MKETLSWGYLESTAIQLQLHSMLMLSRYCIMFTIITILVWHISHMEWMDENVLNEHHAFVINRSIGNIRILA